MDRRSDAPDSEPSTEFAGHQRSPFRWRGVVASAVLVPTALALTVVVALKQFDASSTQSSALSVVDRLADARMSGKTAPAFTLPSVDGAGVISLSQFRGDVVVLNFWASWCTACREEAPQLEAVWRAYAGQGVRFLGIDHLDTRDHAVAFQQQFGITYPSAFDPRGELATQYGLIGIPTTFIIDGQGRLVYRFIGKVDPPTLRAAIDRVRSEQAV